MIHKGPMFPGIDPSKMDPKMMGELSQLIRELSPAQLSRMQTLMHNAMAGFDITREMAEFESSLPAGFREKIAAIMMKNGGAAAFAQPAEQAAPVLSSSAEASSVEMDVRQARLTVLRGVASGTLTPEEAERLLFPSA